MAGVMGLVLMVLPPKVDLHPFDVGLFDEVSGASDFDWLDVSGSDMEINRLQMASDFRRRFSDGL
jgi:hypothetical protein